MVIMLPFLASSACNIIDIADGEDDTIITSIYKSRTLE